MSTAGGEHDRVFRLFVEASRLPRRERRRLLRC